MQKTGKNGRTFVLAGLLALFYAAAGTAGASLERFGYLTRPDGLQVAEAVCFWAFAAIVIILLWTLPDYRKSHGRKIRGANVKKSGSYAGEESACPEAHAVTTDAEAYSSVAAEKRGGKTKRFFIRWLLLCLIDLISLLAVYPGFFVYDAAEELSMVQSRTFTTHHPLLHVLLMGGVILAVHKCTASWNVGIFIWILLQMMVINAAFVYVLEERARRTEADEKTYLWYAFCPTITMFVLCSCKDGLFAVSLMVMTAELRRFLMSDQGWPGHRHVFLYIAAASLMMLFRNNGVYAYAVFFVIFLLSGALYSLTRHRKAGVLTVRMLILLFLPILIYAGVSKGLAAAVHATSNESQEILTVPIMQLGRTWEADADSFTPEEKALMADLVRDPEDGSVNGWDAYNPVLSDQLKLHFRSDVYRARRSEFWNMWFHQARQHPVTFLNAWLMTSYGFWYPEAVIDCYRGNTVYTFTYGDSSYFGYETELPGVRNSLIPFIDQWYRFLSLDARAQKVPLLHLFLSPGMMAWIMAFVLFDMWRKKKRRILLVYLPTFLVWLTVLLGPCALPRYVVYLWFELPLLLAETRAGESI